MSERHVKFKMRDGGVVAFKCGGKVKKAVGGPMQPIMPAPPSRPMPNLKARKVAGPPPMPKRGIQGLPPGPLSAQAGPLAGMPPMKRGGKVRSKASKSRW